MQYVRGQSLAAGGMRETTERASARLKGKMHNPMIQYCVPACVREEITVYGVLLTVLIRRQQLTVKENK